MWFVDVDDIGLAGLQGYVNSKKILSCVAHVLGFVKDIPKQRMQCERVTSDLKPLSPQIGITEYINIKFRVCVGLFIWHSLFGNSHT